MNPYEEERKACLRLGATHLGGPGKPDCMLPNGIPVEVKSFSNRPLRPSDINAIAKKPMYQKQNLLICAVGPQGFTEAAKNRAEQLGMKLSTCSRRQRSHTKR